MSAAELRTMSERTLGVSLPTEQEAAVAIPHLEMASPGDDSDDDDDDNYLDRVREFRTKLVDSMTSPHTGGQEALKTTSIPTQLAPQHFPAISESKAEEDKEEEFHTPVGSPTSTGRQPPPLIPLHSSPEERLIPEGQSNVFPQTMPHHQSE